MMFDFENFPVFGPFCFDFIEAIIKSFRFPGQLSYNYSCTSLLDVNLVRILVVSNTEHPQLTPKSFSRSEFQNGSILHNRNVITSTQFAIMYHTNYPQ